MSQVITFQIPIPPGTYIQTITGDTGGPLSPDSSGNFNFTGGTTGLVFNGASHTETLGGALVVANGGTGNTTFTAYSVICAGTTATGVFQNVSGVGTSGQILTSNGAAMLPTWQAAPASGISLTGDSGGALGPSTSFTFNANSQAGSTVSFSGSGTTMSLNVTDSNHNTIMGQAAGSGSGISNTGLGHGVLFTVTSSLNTGIGAFSLSSLIGGNGSNTAVGYGSLDGLDTGAYNVAIGLESGHSYAGAESSNIVINAVGTLGESNTLRIGAGTGSGNQQLAKAFISGIDGVNVGSVARVVTEASDQLGTATITAGTGISVTRWRKYHNYCSNRNNDVDLHSCFFISLCCTYYR